LAQRLTSDERHSSTPEQRAPTETLSSITVARNDGGRVTVHQRCCWGSAEDKTSMYDVRPDRVGWTVYDVETGRPATLDNLLWVELEHETADELAGLLNRSVYSNGRTRSSKGLYPPMQEGPYAPK
jgi:hypothetical protein